jgi:carboxyl-terminal processing protease
MKIFLTLCLWIAPLAAGLAQSGSIVIGQGGQLVIGGAEKFGGIGAALNKDAASQAFYVAAILPGYGAAKSGMLPNDVITEVNGVPVLGMELKDVITLIRGPAGSAVEVVVARDPNAPPLRFLILREEIKNP